MSPAARFDLHSAKKARAMRRRCPHGEPGLPTEQNAEIALTGAEQKEPRRNALPGLYFTMLRLKSVQTNRSSDDPDHLIRIRTQVMLRHVILSPRVHFQLRSFRCPETWLVCKIPVSCPVLLIIRSSDFSFDDRTKFYFRRVQYSRGLDMACNHTIFPMLLV